MAVDVRYASGPALVPERGCRWADTMVLNPAIIADAQCNRLHMLFRATGPWPDAQVAGKPLPYPIFLGYAWSDDNGRTWAADFDRPALLPALSYTIDGMAITNVYGQSVTNYANGCIEDPRLFAIDGRVYMAAACRMFPPGPYWERDEPMQCAPEWAINGDHPFGRAASENVTVSVLYEVDMAHLASGDYANAFAYVTHLTDPEYGENRDAFLFPEKLTIDGREQYVCIHRPVVPKNYFGRAVGDQPVICVSVADELADFPTGRASQAVLAEPRFEWEGNRIGGSWPPVRIGEDEWLFAYHGKQDDIVGYTQSFMILRQPPNQVPVVMHRCSDRLMYAQLDWEMPSRFSIPCVFSTGGVVVGDELIISYGAADERVGIAWVKLASLIAHVRRFDSAGQQVG